MQDETQNQNAQLPIIPPEPRQTPPPSPSTPLISRTPLIIGVLIAVIIVLLAVIGSGAWYISYHSTSAPQATTTTATAQQPTAQASTTQVRGLQLDTSKNYGNKYADGILPVGDGKYVTSAPKVGYVYACSQYAQNLATDNGGASTRGPWFTNNNTAYDINKKVHVQGSVSWQPSFSNIVNGNMRAIATNELPGHATGVYPIQASDPAYRYDRNPNSIKAQSYTFALAANPTYSTTPNCAGGVVGIMLTGIEIFSAFDAGGRDAGAWEVQDGCSGHPEKTGSYHYHTLSSCIKDVGVKTVLGFALDGFPITGPQISAGNILTTGDLDECHGLTSQIMLDGKSVTTYHYVMTQDFPYSVSCYRGTPIQPPGLAAPSGQQHP